MNAVPSSTVPSQVAVVIPCFKVREQILRVISAVPAGVQWIILVDDCCPQGSGRWAATQAATHSGDPRVVLVEHSVNQGVGGAMVSGFKKALELGARIVVKIDGDGQMDPRILNRFVLPIHAGAADYTKGNRFYRLESLRAMPGMRLFGNAVLSFIVKLASGYWTMMDPTNGYLAIHARVLSLLPLEKLDRRYFFESDLLFRLGTLRAVVLDIPMDSLYADEKSNLRIGKVALEFPPKYLNRFFKRIFYTYFLRAFHFASVELLLGSLLTGFGLCFGLYTWWQAGMVLKTATPTGTIMLATVPFLAGIQLLLAWAQFDMSNIPSDPLSRLTDEGNA